MSLQFPADITSSGRYMTLRFEEYKRRTLNAPAVASVATGSNTIRLPLPNDLVDSQRVQYNESALGPVVGSILENIVGNNRGLPSASEVFNATGISSAASAFTGAAAAGITGVAVATAAAALPLQVRNAISQGTGVAINPFLSVSFETPQFKTHRFAWKLIPRDRFESEAIKEIINTIKAAMLPGVRNIQYGSTTVVGNNLLFDYPNIVEIALTPNEYMYQFKRCVVESFNVNYAPGNAPAFYRSNAPVAVDITIQLKEIEYWTKADYGGTQTAFSFSSNTTPRVFSGEETPNNQR